MASIPFSRDNPMEFPSVQDEKRHLQSSEDAELPHPVNTPNPKKKMSTSKRIVIAVLFGMLVSATLALGPRMAGCLQHRQANAEASRDSLHKLLHDHLPEKFQDGVYPTDEEAIRALHEEHAELASTLVKLAKRQDNSTDSPVEPEPTTTANDPEPTKEPTTTPDDPPTTKETTTTTTSSSSSSSSSSSTPPPPTPTTSDNDEPESTTKKTTSKSSTVHTRTSTLPGGDVTIVTSTSYYDVLPEETGTNKDDPSLQNASPGQAGFAMPALFVAVAGGLLIL